MLNNAETEGWDFAAALAEMALARREDALRERQLPTTEHLPPRTAAEDLWAFAENQAVERSCDTEGLIRVIRMRVAQARKRLYGTRSDASLRWWHQRGRVPATFNVRRCAAPDCGRPLPADARANRVYCPEPRGARCRASASRARKAGHSQPNRVELRGGNRRQTDSVVAVASRGRKAELVVGEAESAGPTAPDQLDVRAEIDKLYARRRSL
jgi:hypothetical protein